MKYAYGQREACAYCGHDIEFHGKEGWRDRGGGRSCLTYYHRLSGDFVTPGTKHSPTKRGAALKKGTTHMDYDLYEPQHRPVLDALLLVQELLGRRPDHGVIGHRRAGLPHGNLGLREGGLQALEPGLGLGIGTAKGDLHGHRAYPARHANPVTQRKA